MVNVYYASKIGAGYYPRVSAGSFLFSDFDSAKQWILDHTFGYFLVYDKDTNEYLGFINTYVVKDLSERLKKLDF